MSNNSSKGWLKPIIDWEAFAGEGIGVSKGLLPERDNNYFGRRILVSDEGPLEFAAGLSMTGIRSAAFLSGEELILGLQVLEEAARHHVPLLVYAYEASLCTLVPLLDRLPCFVLSASSAQIALDQALLARSVSEKALLPGIILLENTGDYSWDAMVMPSGAQLSAFLGSPDEVLESPTPAQEMLFGQYRSRVPRWFNHDLPAFHGTIKKPGERALEKLARQKFFEDHLEEILESERTAFQKQFGRSAGSFHITGPERAEGLVLSNGLEQKNLRAAQERFVSKAKHKPAIIEIVQWHPFPSEALRATILSASHFTVVESPGSGFNAWLQRVLSPGSRLEWHRGTATAPLDAREAEGLFENMDKGGRQLRDFALGSVFDFRKSGLPQYEVLLQRIKRAYPKLEASALVWSDRNFLPESPSGRVSRFVRRYQDGGPPYARLSHFAQHAVYPPDAEGESAVDPFKALPLMPAASSALNNWGGTRKMIPVLEPQGCTACGICSVACPHAALPGLALNIESLLRGGLDIAIKRDTPLSSLTPLVKNLSKAIGALLVEKAENTVKLSEVLVEAFQQLVTQMGLQAEKREQVQKDIAILAEILRPWPTVVAEDLFRVAESRDPGSGILFAVAADPAACTGCGICADACPEKVIRMVSAQEPDLHEEAKRFALWEGLPDMPEPMLEQLVAPGSPRAVFALYWSRKRFQVMAGGGKEVEGNGAKALLHAFQTVLLHLQAEKRSALEQRVQAVIDQLAAKIHATLSDALPKKAFTDLSGALAQVQGTKAPLDTLFSGLAENAHLGKIDTTVLRRQVDLLTQLQNLSWLLREGTSGAGRATFGLLFGGQVPEWVGQFPSNHFTVPVFLRSGGDYAAFANGLMEGQVRHYLDNLRLLRRGELEVKGRYQASEHDATVAALSYENLTEEERQGIAPLCLLFFGDRPIQEKGINSSRPMVIVHIADGKVLSPMDMETNFASFLAHSFGNKPIAQTSLGNPDHFFHAVKTVFQGNSTGYLRLFAPEIPGRDILSASRIALHTRAFPLMLALREDSRDMARISLEGNPAPDADWPASGVEFSRLFGKKGEYMFTYVDWLNTLPEREDFLSNIDVLPTDPVQVATYLELDQISVRGKTPLAVQTDPGRSIGQPLEASPQAIVLVQTALRNWTVLRDRAKSWKEIWEKREVEIEVRHQMAIQQVKEECERKYLLAEEKWKKQTLERLRDNLIQMTKAK